MIIYPFHVLPLPTRSTLPKPSSPTVFLSPEVWSPKDVATTLLCKLLGTHPPVVIMEFTVPETNSKSTWKWMVGIRSFPFGARPIFRGELLNFLRVGALFFLLQEPPTFFLTPPQKKTARIPSISLGEWENPRIFHLEIHPQNSQCSSYVSLPECRGLVSTINQLSNGSKTLGWHSIESWLVKERDPYNGLI